METTELTVRTGRTFATDLTREVAGFCRGRGDGLVNVFVPHATAGVAVLETGSGSEADLAGAVDRLLPRGDVYRHRHGSAGARGGHRAAGLLGPPGPPPPAGGGAGPGAPARSGARARSRAAGLRGAVGHAARAGGPAGAGHLAEHRAGRQQRRQPGPPGAPELRGRLITRRTWRARRGAARARGRAGWR